MKIINELGVDPILLVAQIVNFLIIFFILKKFLYKPVLEMLKNREETIKDGLRKAEEAQILLEKTAEKEKEVLKKAQKEAIKIIEDAKTQAQELTQKTEESLKSQTEKMINEAQIQIQQEAKRAEQELAGNISNLSIQFLQKAVGELFGKEHQEEILAKALKQLRQKPN